MLLFLVLLSFESKLVMAGDTSLAFEGALGFGRFTQGGNGGEIYVVDTLDDSSNPIKGMLRHAVNAKGPRIIVFTVSGVIELVKPLEIKHDFITIAGQTSPKGIVLKGAETQIKANQVIIRYLRFRHGTSNHQSDAITAKRNSNIIIDHCSMSWANDEVASFYNNTDFTLQYSIISESLNDAGHNKGSHGYGGIWGGRRASFLFNVLAHHTSRNPRINGHRLKPTYSQEEEFAEINNNVIYNWSKNSAYGNENGKLHFINNYFKPGPSNGPIRFFQLLNSTEKGANGRGFFRGNVMVGYPEISNLNRLGLPIKNQKTLQPEDIRLIHENFTLEQLFRPLNIHTVDNTVDAKFAYQRLIVDQEVGANRNRHGKKLDSVDLRILTEIKSATASTETGIIDSELQVIESWDSYASEFSNDGVEHIPNLYMQNNQQIELWLNNLGKF
ncbi:pectate lyase family protein [Aliiglaciecola lipolytica]|uniref:Probable pectate lyase C n=1 Tax=Aliiglaciecola lipolytica E3 TaxID=1127673 RepID=K6YT50_9ALTE|nr:pectate lyase C [Aliiglaciecola lipolytica]GAC14475.1 probable pectate lyase C [Aliiglaciecola lipolytica E3]